MSKQGAVVEAKAFSDLVCQSAALRHIVSLIDLVARTEASVLILDEAGTGKELVAHEIHRRSGRVGGSLVEVPSLRDRMDDIPLLAKQSVELSAKELKCAKPRVTRAAVADSRLAATVGLKSTSASGMKIAGTVTVE